MRSAFIGTVFACVLGTSAASADDFFSGKTIKLISATQVGASYDSFARLVARHMPKHIPGSPKIIVQNMPAAQGLVAINNVYNQAPRDGTTIGLFKRASILSSIVGDEQARYKSERFNWLGTTASFEDNPFLLLIRSALPQKSIDELRGGGKTLHVGNSGSPLLTLLQRGLSLNVKIINGYGQSDLDLAFERGEVDITGTAYTNLIARQPHWIERKFIRALVQFGRAERLGEFPDVPTGREIARNPMERGLIDLAEASLLFAYPFGLPPDVPAERVAIMRQAFSNTMNDPAYREDVAKAKLEYSPRDGQAVQATIDNIAKMPPDIINRFKEIVLSSRAGGD